MESETDSFLADFGSEENIAQRIQEEMKARGWSQAKLSKEMAARGYPIHQSAISKIINPPGGDGRRSVSVDEALGLAKTFGIELADLLVPSYVIALKRSDQKFFQRVEGGAHTARQLLEAEYSLPGLAERVAKACQDEERGPARVEALRRDYERLKPIVASLDTSGPSANGDPDPFGRGKYDPDTGVSEYYIDSDAGRFRFIQEVLDRLDKGSANDGE
jgi:transcriptional regulator with XRE-family HTH domain